MKYTVKPVTVDGCDCEDCKAGRHLYFLFRCAEVETGDWSGVTLHTYASAQECKDNHYWGIRFGPDDTWEDGSPIVQPNPLEGMRTDDREASNGGMVPLNMEILKKSTEMLERHWRSGDSTS